MSNDDLVLGIDVGGTKLAGVAVGPADEVIARLQAPRDATPLDRQVVAMAEALLAAAGATRATAIGVAVPGQVDRDSGVMRLAVNLDEQELAIGPRVAAALDAPCYLEHDARAAAVWLMDGPGDGPTNLAYLSVGTGISAAVIVDGSLVRGVAGLAGEIGHIQAVEDGQACQCGLSGCLEAVAAGPALARMVADGRARGVATSLPDGAGPEEVYAAATDGDELAGQIAATVGTHLARAIRGLLLSHGVDRVVIGGGLSRAGAAFLGPINDELDRERSASALVRQAVPVDAVRLLPPDSDAGALGAAMVARAGSQERRSGARGEREVPEGG